MLVGVVSAVVHLFWSGF
ncbi:hypothetical protein POUND7_008429 [Theobroma cacao]